MLQYQNPLDSEFLTVRDVLMLPKNSTINSRSDVALRPFIYSAPMDTVTGLSLAKTMLEQKEYPVISRFINKDERIECIKQFAFQDHVFFAVGFNDWQDLIGTSKHYHKDAIINVALDIAHGDMQRVHELTKELRNSAEVGYIMSGSICTPEAALNAIKAGCTHLRIGVGPGAACTTRLMTGIGMPQLSAVYRIHRFLESVGERQNVVLIADGGIKDPGHAALYLAAGADAIMMGSEFSKCFESAGWTKENNKLVKSYRGQASAAFQKSIYGKANKCPEGAASAPFEWKGATVKDVIDYYRGGIVSSCSYQNIHAIWELNPDNVQFIKITPSGYHEGTPHGV